MSRSTRIIIFFALVVVFTLTVRLVPHIPNITPVLAVAMLAGTYLPRTWALGVPVGIMVVSDAFIGGYSPLIMGAVYGSILLVVGVGWYLRAHKTAGNVLAGSLGASLAFFLVTNWAVWQFTAMYPAGVEGLLMSYTAALPFFKNTLIGTVGYTLVLFPAFEVFCNYRFVKEWAGKYVAEQRSTVVVDGDK